MRIFGFEIKREPRPNLSRDVIPGMQAMLNTLSDGQIDITKKLDEVSKKAEATRRKVYRDGEPEFISQAEVDSGRVVPAGSGDNHSKELRTGDIYPG